MQGPWASINDLESQVIGIWVSRGFRDDYWALRGFLFREWIKTWYPQESPITKLVKRLAAEAKERENAEGTSEDSAE